MNRRWWSVALVPVLVFLAIGPPAGAAEDQAEKKPVAVKDAVSQPGDAGKTPVLTKPAVFEMEEVLAFGKQETAGGLPIRFPQGQYASCRNVPIGEVKAYPQLRSKQPLYGAVTFDTNYYDPTPGITYYFVLDESGEAEATESPKTEKKDGGTLTTKKPSLLESLAKALTGSAPAAVDAFRVQEPKCTYDRLYFDLNGDRDLTNDGVIQVAEKPIFADLPTMRESPSTRYFNELAVSFDFGAPVGKRPFVLVPRVQVYGQGMGMIQFIPKMARRGKIRLGGQEYVASLTQSSTVSGRYDRPFVQLEVFAADPSSKAAPLLKSGPLAQMQVVDEQFLTVSASPLGDKLSIVPYRGDFGILQLGTGTRPLTEFGVVGQLVGRSTIVLLGESSFAAPETLSSRYQVPVGDYMLPTLTARYGRVRFSARMMPSAGQAAGPAFPVQIRKDKPYILEFSAKPEVKFVSPRGNQTFTPGTNVYIAAMLSEPFQGIQITGLWDATNKERTARYILEGGREVTVPQYAKLDPTIVIRNSAGKEVATGTMPFG